MSDIPDELIELAGEICSRIAEFGEPAQETVARALMAERERAARWHDQMETAPKSGYIVVATPDGSHWRFAEVFDEHDEWINVHSDRVEKPTHWARLPTVNKKGPASRS